MVDPSNYKLPINLTKWFGQRNNIKFRLLGDDGKIYNSKDVVILTAFNIVSKYNGFYKIKLDSVVEPELLSMKPAHIFTQPRSGKCNLF